MTSIQLPPLPHCARCNKAYDFYPALPDEGIVICLQCLHQSPYAAFSFCFSCLQNDIVGCYTHYNSPLLVCKDNEQYTIEANSPAFGIELMECDFNSDAEAETQPTTTSSVDVDTVDSNSLCGRCFTPIAPVENLLWFECSNCNSFKFCFECILKHPIKTKCFCKICNKSFPFLPSYQKTPPKFLKFLPNPPPSVIDQDQQGPHHRNQENDDNNDN